MRRPVLAWAAIALLLAMTATAVADTWPSRPIRMIVAFPPGGPADIAARTFADPLGQELGQSVVVENRAGGNSVIGMQAAQRATPDGYTLVLMTLAGAAIHPNIRKTPYDTLTDFAPIGRVADAFFGVAVHPSVPAESLAALIAYAKANPGKLHFGSASVGGTTHLGPEIFAQEAGIVLTHVPYRGSSEALNDLLAGHIQLQFDSIVFPHHKAGKLRVLAVTTPERRPEWPDIPSIQEVVPGFDLANWLSVAAPAGTPPAVIARVSAALNRAAARDDVRERLLQVAMRPTTDTPEAMAADIRRQHERFGALVRKLGLQEPGG